MFQRIVTKAALIAFACTASLAVNAYAIDRKPIEIPAGELATALRMLAAQAGVEFFYQSELVKGLHTDGVTGVLSAEEAVAKLLEGTSLTLQVDSSGAMLIGRAPVAPKPEGGDSSAKSSSSGQSTQTGSAGESRSFWKRNRIAQAETASSERVESTDGTKLEEIVVTAQKREERARDVPMSISALTGRQLEDARITNTLDLSFAVPGLAVAETGPGRQIIVVRGLGSERGSSSLTGLYLDEMPVSGAQDGFNQSYIDLRTLDLERVEVLKGPQGTLFGEGSVGGTVRFITREPELDAFSGSLNTSLYSTSDSSESKEIVGVANLPLAQDVFGLRIAATYEDKAGWIDQPSVGRKNINDNEVFNVRTKALWKPTAQLSVKGMVVVHHNNGGASNIVNQSPRDESVFLQALAFNGASWDRSAPTDFTDEYKLYNLAVTYDFGFAELLGSTSYANIDSVASFTQLLGTLPQPSLEILFRDYVQAAKIKSQEARLTSSGEGPFRWTLGAFYKESDLAKEWRSGYDFVYPALSYMLTGVTAGSVPTSKSESLAEYVDASYTFAKRFRIGGGLALLSG